MPPSPGSPSPAASCSSLVSWDHCSTLLSSSPGGGGGLLPAFQCHCVLPHPLIIPTGQPGAWQSQQHIPRTTLPIEGPMEHLDNSLQRSHELLELVGGHAGDGTQGLIGSTQTLKQGADDVSGSAPCTWPGARNMLATTPTYQQQTTLQTACRQAAA